MRAQILKIAGVKSEKDFYKKFPTEESFMAKHGKTLKKAKIGANLKQGFAGGFNPLSMGVDENFQIRINSGESPKFGDYLNAYGEDAIGAIGGIAQGINAFKGQKNKYKELKQQRMVSDVQLDASRTRPEQIERKYVRPEDVQNTGEEFFPIYGVGTNVLAKNGKQIKYAQDGGGFSNFMNQGGTDVANKLIGGAFDNNAGYQTGAAVGNALNKIPGVGPVVGAIAAPVLGTIGGALDQVFGNAGKIKKEQGKIDRNVNNIMGNQFGQNIQSQYNNYMRTGGNIRQNSNMDGDLQIGKGSAQTLSYNPFLPDEGETVMFRGPSHANGGMPIAYGNNPVEVEGGEPAVKLQDGGNNENLTVYGNLKIPKGFEQIDPLAKGKKFKNYINDLSKIEDRQNKIIENSTKELNDLDVITSFDKLKLKTLEVNELGANMKLKSIADKKIKAADLQNAINSTAEEFGLSADHLAKGKIKKEKINNKAKNGDSIYKAQKGGDIPKFFNTYTEEQTSPSTIQLSDEELEIKPIETDYKQFIEKYFSNDAGFTDEERKKAYEVMMMESAGNPSAVGINNNEKLTNPKGQYWNSQDSGLFQINNVAHANAYSQGNILDPEYNVQVAAKIATQAKKLGKDPFSPWTSYASKIKNSAIPSEEELQLLDEEAKFNRDMDLGLLNNNSTSQNSNTPTTQNSNDAEGYKRSWLMDAFNEVLPYIRPSDKEGLNYNQLTGEMYALSNNQLEPVQAQSYHPQLTTPYDISLQDQLNEITAQQRAAQKILVYNPAAQANLAAQTYNAKNKVLGEQFRLNQAKKDQVYSQNINTMNYAQLKNLQIYDQQYQRQAQAKSNTKDVTQAALNSISSKYAQNQLENRTLQTYENMYNYRFGNDYRAQNFNGFFQPNIDTNKPSLATPGINPNKKTSRNGSIVKAIKNL